MSTEYRAKVFKSGNSLALRLPKALGLKEGAEMILREDQAKYTFEPAETPGKKLDISGFWGKATGLTVPPREDFDERPSTIARRQQKDSGVA
jgi:antitoxin VapB